MIKSAGHIFDQITLERTTNYAILTTFFFIFEFNEKFIKAQNALIMANAGGKSHEARLHEAVFDTLSKPIPQMYKEPEMIDRSVGSFRSDRPDHFQPADHFQAGTINVNFPKFRSMPLDT